MRWSWQITLLVFTASSACVGADLTRLPKGTNVRIAIVGRGHICAGTIQQVRADSAEVSVTEGSIECGAKGHLLWLRSEQVAELVPEERLTKRRAFARVMVAAGAVAALTAIPLNSSDPESWLVLGNAVIPGFVAYGGWHSVPPRRDYLILLACPDPRQCFAP